MQDRYEDLRTFVAVVEAEGFSGAALRLGVVKSAVSRRISELEDRLGTQLLVRSTRSMSVTEAGATLYERALRLLEDLHDAETEVASGSSALRGKLRVAGPMSFGVMCLAPLAAEFADQHPDLAVELDLNDRIVNIVNEGFDLAIRISRLKDSSLVARSIASVEHTLCASPAYLAAHGVPRMPHDLLAHRGLAYSNLEESAYWSFCDPAGGPAFSVEVRSPFRVNNGAALREAAIQGHGIAYLPHFIVAQAIARGELRPLLEDWRKPSVEVYAVYPTRRNLPLRVRAFIDFLMARCTAR
ncbi:LysR family transcriptional regulator [Pseudoduganella violaceinigra]|uniref:LysR family transcriptional regulator n=1 Tax=Pseudoduganella violaceinigra TaxID=246602 RepID=UPI000406B4A7|nr:LysR family transcriptional regulator [Pseudoduganella violaceinigra]